MEAHRRPDADLGLQVRSQVETGAVTERDRRRLVILIVAVAVFVCAFIFWAQNHQRVSISYLTVSIGAPLWPTVTGYFLAGVLVGVLLTLYYQRHQS